MWGRGWEGVMALAPLCRILVTPSSTHNQIGPLWCWFPSGWACACSKPLWVSPTNSPVRLGVLPAAASTPTGCFHSEVWGFISLSWSPGLRGLLCSLAIPPGLSTCECGAAGSVSHHLVNVLAAAWPAGFHNPPPRWVRQPSPCRESSPPGLPVSAPPTGLDECFFFISLFVRLPYSSIFCQFWLFFCF